MVTSFLDLTMRHDHTSQAVFQATQFKSMIMGHDGIIIILFER